MATDLFKKYYSRIAKEGIIKSMLLGLVVGFAALAICALASWFFGFKEGLWVSIALFVVGTAASAPVFYYVKFRPTTKEIAKRVDELGLEERVLTMTELENDDSYIAMKQREDTMKALKSVNHLLLPILVSASVIVACALTAVAGFGMTTVSSLYYADVIPSGISLIEQSVPVSSYTLTYTTQVGSGGKIVYWDGNWDEEVEFTGDLDKRGDATYSIQVDVGGNGPQLYALTGDGWTFVGWSDGVLSPYRHDVDVNGNINVVALYEKIGGDTIPDDDGLLGDPNGNGQPGNQKGREPGRPNSSNDSNGDDGVPGPSDFGGGMSREDNQQIIDGETYYGDTFENDYNDAMDRLGSDDSMSGDLKDVVSDYFDSIAKGGSGNNSNP